MLLRYIDYLIIICIIKVIMKLNILNNSNIIIKYYFLIEQIVL